MSNYSQSRSSEININESNQSGSSSGGTVKIDQNSSGSDGTVDSKNYGDFDLTYQQDLYILPSYQMHEALVAKSATADESQSIQFSAPAYELDDELDYLHSLPLLQDPPDLILRSHDHEYNLLLLLPPPLPPLLLLQMLQIPLQIPLQSRNQTVPSGIFTRGSSTSLPTLSSMTPGEQMSSFTQFSAASGNTSASTTLSTSSTKVLDIHHELKKLNNGSNISLSIHFTKEQGKVGHFPTIVDSDTREYSSGDNVYGFVIVLNKGSTPISFNTFYVLLEGNIVVSPEPSTNSSSGTNKTFLQSIDLSASSLTTSTNPRLDPLDNTCLDFHTNNELKPNTMYKRFFQFVIPHQLLESPTTQVAGAAQYPLPPTIDLTVPNSLTFLYTNIIYTVQTKFISNDTGSYNYLTLKEEQKEIRIIPKERFQVTDNNISKLEEYSLEYLVLSLTDYIEMVKRERGILNNEETTKHNYAISDKNEPQQLPRNLSNVSYRNHTTKFNVNKSTFGHLKTRGTLAVTVPMHNINISYIPPLKYRTTIPSNRDIESWNLNIPISLKFQDHLDKSKLPEVSNVEASLNVFSYEANNSLPFEIKHNMIFNNETKETFKEIVQDRLRNLATELAGNVQHLRQDQVLPLEPGLLDDVKSLSSLKTKITILDVNDISMEGASKSNAWKTSPYSRSSSVDLKHNLRYYTKDLQVKINLTNCIERRAIYRYSTVPAYDKFCLVPDFQNCLTGRLYFLTLSINLLNGSITSTKIPISIKKLV